MRRTTIILSAAVMLLMLGPASALARHHHSRHHRSRAHHARLLHFGDTSNSSTSSNSADNAGTVTAFTGDLLTITTSDGPISGHVTGQTECMAPSSQPPPSAMP